MTLLLTLATGSLGRRMASKEEDRLEPMDLPGFVGTDLQLHGLSLNASMLSGWSLEDLVALRDVADRLGCPCLVLVEEKPLAVGSRGAVKATRARDRVQRLALAANRLGCSSLAITCEGPDTDEVLNRTADHLRDMLRQVEQLELNLLLAPGEGLTSDPDRLTHLIKRVGGFRIGSMPTFVHAASTDDPVATLRKLAPYAGAIQASVDVVTRRGKHKAWDLAKYVGAIRAVGYQNTLAIDFLGEGDEVVAIERARDILQAAIDDT